VLSTTAHAAADAPSVRHSLRPLLSEGRELQTSGASRGENAESHLAVIASEAKQSILSLCGEMDCFASLAMTVVTLFEI
jgi:hypothetical protein